jgi:hypothetical protein
MTSAAQALPLGRCDVHHATDAAPAFLGSGSAGVAHPRNRRYLRPTCNAANATECCSQWTLPAHRNAVRDQTHGESPGDRRLVPRPRRNAHAGIVPRLATASGAARLRLGLCDEGAGSDTPAGRALLTAVYGFVIRSRRRNYLPRVFVAARMPRAAGKTPTRRGRVPCVVACARLAGVAHLWSWR